MDAAKICKDLDTLISLIEDIPHRDPTPKPVYRIGTKRHRLYQPSLGSISLAITEGLQKNFKQVTVKVVKCPDLREWANLSAKGICGNTRLIDAGGVPYMFDPEMQATVNYCMQDLIHACDMKAGLVIGAGAADPKVIGKNGELVPNLKVPSGANHTHYAKMIDKGCMDADDARKSATSENAGNDVPVCRTYASDFCGCLCNLFVSDGHCNDSVLYIKAKSRIGKLNFTNCIRESLQNVKGCGGDKQIGMGGVIKVSQGRIKGHVMPDFMKECVDIMDPKQIAVDNWLHFYECGPNLVMMATLISGDPSKDNSMHLRVEHTHFYTLSKGVNEGGHYHYDTTPDEIEYEAYLNTAEFVYRVDDAFQYNINKAGDGGHKFDASLIK